MNAQAATQLTREWWLAAQVPTLYGNSLFWLALGGMGLFCLTVIALTYVLEKERQQTDLPLTRPPWTHHRSSAPLQVLSPEVLEAFMASLGDPQPEPLLELLDTAMWQCQKCGSIHDVSVQICVNCGTHLTAS